MSALYGGVETGGSWCVCGLGSADGKIEARAQFPTTAPDETIEQIVSFFAAHPAPVAVGVGAFGPVDLHRDSPTWGYITTTPKPGWQHVALGPTLQQRLQVPVAFETDVNAAATAERKWGAGRGCGSVCYLTVGTGIGAGLTVEARPWHGLIHPEVGHIRIPHDIARDPFPGSCPSHGDCWEGLASGVALADRWQQSPAELPDDHPAWALEAEYLAHGILSIICIASPERVILGGGVMQRPQLLPTIRERLRALLNGYLESPLLGERIDDYLVSPALGDDAGVLGAIALAHAATA